MSETPSVTELIALLLRQDPTEVGNALRAAREGLRRQIAVANALLNEDALPHRRKNKSKAFNDVSNEQILEELRELAAKLGRTPSQLDLVAHPDKPSRDLLRRRFGSLGKAMAAAGLEPNVDNIKRARAREQREHPDISADLYGKPKWGRDSTTYATTPEVQDEA